MILKCGITDESYKYCYGIESKSGHLDDIFKQSTIRLVSARRDWAAFQILLEAQEDFALSLGKNPVFSPKGPLKNIRLEVEIGSIQKVSVTMNPIGLVEDDDRIFKADMLMPDEMIHVEREKVQPVWVEINIPEDTKPGKYHGYIKIFSHAMFEDEIEVKRMNFELEVSSVKLPEAGNYHFYLDLWQHLSNIARKHEVALWSDEHFKVLEEYVKSLAALGQKAVTVIVSEIPWSGQRSFYVKNYLSDMFEYSMVRVEKNIDGQFVYDFSAAERYIELCFKYGIDSEIEVFGLSNIWVAPEAGYGAVAEDYPDAIRIRYLDKVDGCYKYIKSGRGIRDYISALEKYFIKKGWIDKVRVVADEPSDVDLYRKRLKELKESAPAFKFKTAINHVEFIDEFKAQVQDFVPILPCVCSGWETLKDLRNTIDGRLLWYVCCWPPIPNTFISSPLLESRLIGLLTAYMNLDGFLRWNYTVWPENPRERISYKYPQWKAGDTNFVYPARDGSPILTLRYKMLKRGIEDFELVHMLKEVHPEPDIVMGQVWKTILKTGNIREFEPKLGKRPDELYSTQYTDYCSVKKILLGALEKDVKDKF